MARIRRGGKRIRGSNGGRTRNEDCCCDETPCDCETDGPTADFTATQTDDDPCTFNFTDTSTAGACGAIVEYIWLCNGVPFSTDENPSGVDMEDVCGGPGPWDVTHVVIDEEGCEDSVIAEITCTPVGTCRGCTNTPAAFVTVEIAGMADDECDSCASDFNGSHTLWYTSRDGGYCHYEKHFGVVCDDDEIPPPILKVIQASIVQNFDPTGPTPTDDYLRVDLKWAASGFQATYIKDWNPFPADCAGTHTLDLNNSTQTNLCDPPATVDLTI